MGQLWETLGNPLVVDRIKSPNHNHRQPHGNRVRRSRDDLPTLGTIDTELIGTPKTAPARLGQSWVMSPGMCSITRVYFVYVRICIYIYIYILYYIVLYYIISYYIILYHIISYCIILYHIISYHIILYYIILLYIIFLSNCISDVLSFLYVKSYVYAHDCIVTMHVGSSYWKPLRKPV